MVFEVFEATQPRFLRGNVGRESRVKFQSSQGSPLDKIKSTNTGKVAISSAPPFLSK